MKNPNIFNHCAELSSVLKAHWLCNTVSELSVHIYLQVHVEREGLHNSFQDSQKHFFPGSVSLHKFNSIKQVEGGSSILQWLYLCLENKNKLPAFLVSQSNRYSAFSPKLVPRKCKKKMSVCLWFKCVFFLSFFLWCSLPPSLRFHSRFHLSVRPSVQSPSHTQQPEEEEDGHEQEEGILPVVIAVVEVTVALMIAGILVWWGGRGLWQQYVRGQNVCYCIFNAAWRQQHCLDGAFNLLITRITRLATMRPAIIYSIRTFFDIWHDCRKLWNLPVYFFMKVAKWLMKQKKKILCRSKINQLLFVTSIYLAIFQFSAPLMWTLIE